MSLPATKIKKILENAKPFTLKINNENYSILLAKCDHKDIKIVQEHLLLLENDFVLLARENTKTKQLHFTCATANEIDMTKIAQTLGMCVGNGKRVSGFITENWSTFNKFII